MTGFAALAMTGFVALAMTGFVAFSMTLCEIPRTKSLPQIGNFLTHFSQSVKYCLKFDQLEVKSQPY
jgi:hypothetical protein